MICPLCIKNKLCHSNGKSKYIYSSHTECQKDYNTKL